MIATVFLALALAAAPPHVRITATGPSGADAPALAHEITRALVATGASVVVGPATAGACADGCVLVSVREERAGHFRIDVRRNGRDATVTLDVPPGTAPLDRARALAVQARLLAESPSAPPRNEQASLRAVAPAKTASSAHAPAGGATSGTPNRLLATSGDTPPRLPPAPATPVRSVRAVEAAASRPPEGAARPPATASNADRTVRDDDATRALTDAPTDTSSAREAASPAANDESTRSPRDARTDAAGAREAASPAANDESTRSPRDARADAAGAREAASPAANDESTRSPRDARADAAGTREGATPAPIDAMRSRRDARMDGAGARETATPAPIDAMRSRRDARMDGAGAREAATSMPDDDVARSRNDDRTNGAGARETATRAPARTAALPTLAPESTPSLAETTPPRRATSAWEDARTAGKAPPTQPLALVPPITGPATGVPGSSGARTFPLLPALAAGGSGVAAASFALLAGARYDALPQSSSAAEARRNRDQGKAFQIASLVFTGAAAGAVAWGAIAWLTGGDATQAGPIGVTALPENGAAFGIAGALP